MSNSIRLPKNYNPDNFPHPSVAVDLAVFALDKQRLLILLIKRGIHPYKGYWALPGGFVGIKEDLATAAARELAEETGLKKAYLEQLYTFGEPKRDPRTRVISVAYFALLPDIAKPLKSGTDASDAAWYDINDLPKLAFDHQKIIRKAWLRLRGKAQYSTIVKGLLPLTFTLSDLQRAYEALLARPLDKRNFRKRVIGLNLVQSTGVKSNRLSARPASLYKFSNKKVVLFK